AQGINAAGSASWIAGGVQVANESQTQSTAQLITDGAGGAIVAWQDTRSTADYDIYSSRLFANGTLPLRLISFSATDHNGDVLLAWETDNEINTSRFDIEFSTNGSSFTKLGEVAAKNLPGRNQYDFTHVAPADNILFYRLRQIDIDGRSEYTNIVKVVIDRTPHLTLYPNPATDFIQIKNIRAEEVQNIQAIGSDGRMVMICNPNNQMQYDISHLKTGIYILKLVKRDHSVSISRFEKQ
ncbi:MAG: T9SS type A sorting domain-containing protein, partial [Chitinophagaceae bacterium]